MKKITGILFAVMALSLAAGACSSEGNVFSLEVGMCFDDYGVGEVSDVPRANCAEPHDNEVYATWDVSDPVLPSQTTMAEGCYDRFEAAIGEPYETSIYDFGMLTPTQGSWDQGDREVVCYAYTYGGAERIVGSVLGSGR